MGIGSRSAEPREQSRFRDLPFLNYRNLCGSQSIPCLFYLFEEQQYCSAISIPAVVGTRVTKGGQIMPIMEDQRQERIFRDYPTDRYDRGDYLVRDRDYRKPRERVESNALAVVAASSSIKTIGGVAVAVLAILALIGVIPRISMAIAGIVFGASILFEGLGITGEYRKLARLLADTSPERFELAGSTGLEVAVGVAAIALAILALIGVEPATLIPVLIITGGTGLMIAVGTVHRLNDFRLTTLGVSDLGRRLHNEWIAGGAIVQTLAGLAALVLGILSLIWAGTTPAGYGTLAQIGMICLGVAAAIGGGAIAGRSTMLYRRS
jgi:hypothetical protein